MNFQNLCFHEVQASTSGRRPRKSVQMMSASSSVPGGSAPRRNSDPDSGPYVKSQEHLLTATDYNPQPTAVPPPIAANAGTLGVRHVLCIIGLPERGKPYIARRLQLYLSFFHGADVRVFNIADYAVGPSGCDENAETLLDDVRKFMEKRNEAASNNMDVPSRIGSASVSEDPTETPLSHQYLIDEADRRRKNVDSGKVAIIMSTDANATFKEKWSGTSKERRQWLATTLAQDRVMGAKLIFIEVIVNQPHLIEANIRAKRRAQGLGETSAAAMREHHIKVKHYARMYVTLQDDGSEDDLSYIKLYNYGGKVITNRMHGYLRMRIAQFLTTVHTTPHVIYLSRHGQSEYNVMGKIGGNPPLSTAGEEYARRLGKWVPDNICRTPDGRPIKSRLWTSSLQRTILTAEHIPHPLIPCRELFDAYGNEIHSSSSLVLADGWRGHPSSPTADGVVSFGIMPTHPATLAATLAADASRGLGKMPTPPSPLPSRMPSEATLADPPALKLEHSESGPASSEPPTEPSELDGVLHSEELWEQMSPRVYRNLDEIFAGEYEGMSYEDIERLMPEEASLRSMDKIGYRYPRGESYFDILARLDPLVHEMESYREPVLIVSHQAVLRVLYAYLMAKPRSSAPKIEIPLHTIMKITYDGWNPPYEERVYLGPEPLSESPDKPANDGQKKL